MARRRRPAHCRCLKEAHGDPDMPVWGEVFSADSVAPVGRRIEIQGKLMLLTDYVRSIQVP